MLAALIGLVRAGGWQLSGRERSCAAALAATWLLIHAAVGLFFSPAGNPEFWILSLIPAWLLALCLFVPTDGRRGALAVLMIALFAHNLVGGLAVYNEPDGDRVRAKGHWLIENTGPGDAILTADSPFFARYLRYWAGGEVFDLQYQDEVELSRIWSEVTAVPGKVYATHDVFAPPDYYRALRPVEGSALVEFGHLRNREFEPMVSDEFGGIWVLPNRPVRSPTVRESEP